MTNKALRLTFTTFAFLFIIKTCKPQLTESTEWTTNCTQSIFKDKIYFTFPADKFAFNRDSLIKESFLAIKHDLAVLGKTEFTDTIKIQFVRSRKEMRLNTGFSYSGMPVRFMKTLWVVADKNDIEPPITHEMMHYLSMSFWGVPSPTNLWLNEGLATYAINKCNHYSVEEVYAFLLHKNMLLPIDSLTNSFTNQPDMIAYHQSAYTVQFLIEKYGIDKLRQFWQANFSDFYKIYGTTYKIIEQEMKATIRKKYPVSLDIDWMRFEKGCK
ncbi:MAG: peptidase MA family metallohydrolase [Bacteroidia bacterium]